MVAAAHAATIAAQAAVAVATSIIGSRQIVSVLANVLWTFAASSPEGQLPALPYLLRKYTASAGRLMTTNYTGSRWPTQHINGHRNLCFRAHFVIFDHFGHKTAPFHAQIPVTAPHSSLHNTHQQVFARFLACVSFNTTFLGHFRHTHTSFCPISCMTVYKVSLSFRLSVQ